MNLQLTNDDLSPELRLANTTSPASLGAWFLGPKAENGDVLKRLIERAIDEHIADRKAFEPGDPEWIDAGIKGLKAYEHAVVNMERLFESLLKDLKDSIPFFSYRYQSHMLWDVTLPAVAAYFAAMLYNQNNVAAEASPITTLFEMEVGDDLCRMLGYKVPATTPRVPASLNETELADAPRRAWGHLTCDGSVANLESMWSARNLKFFPVALAAALRNDGSPIAHARRMRVPLANGHSGILAELDTWTQLNLRVSDVLALPRELHRYYAVTPEKLTEALAPASLQRLGFLEFAQRYLGGIKGPCVVGSATMHYSWQKAATVLGIGERHLFRVPVDNHCRLDLAGLRAVLDRCLDEHRPVVQVVAVMGTTEHSAVDPLAHILELREEYRRSGLEFAVHVDAAWGGYFASLLRKRVNTATSLEVGEDDSSEEDASEAPDNEVLDAAVGSIETKGAAARGQREITARNRTEADVAAVVQAQATLALRDHRAFGPSLVMSPYVVRQYKALKNADSVTVDPHKSGYIPYPAGGLCYRDSSMRDLVSLRAPVVYHGVSDPTIGVYGIEGSKPGAAAAAVLLSHRVIRPDREGYGMILGKTMFNATRFYMEIIKLGSEQASGDRFPFTVCDPVRPSSEKSASEKPPSEKPPSDGSRRFAVSTLQPLPAEREGKRPSTIADQRKLLVELAELSNENLVKTLTRDPVAARLFRDVGPDLNIVPYAFNFFVEARDADGNLLRNVRGEVEWVPNQDIELLNRFNDDIFKQLSNDQPIRKELPLIVTESSLDPTALGSQVVGGFLRRLGIRTPPDHTYTTPVTFLISTVANPWLTDTAEGNMIPRLMTELKAVVCKAVKRIQRDRTLTRHLQTHDHPRALL